MLRSILILVLPVCGLVARPSAQVHVGVTIGAHVSVHAGGARVHHGSSRRGSFHRVRRVPVQPRLVTDRATDRLLPRRVCRETVTRRVWVPGHWQLVTVPARYEWRCDPCGRRYRVQVCAATTQRVWRAGYWRVESLPVLVAARR